MNPEIEALSSTAEVIRTPCGSGEAVWRSWGTGTPLVLLHGGSGSWMHWLRNIGPLSRHYRVLAPDTPGLGESAMPPAPEPSPENAAQPLREGLRLLLGERRFYHLCGFSFGANVAGHLAAAEGAHVRSLTVVGAASLGLARPPLDLLKVRDKQGAERREANRENLARLMIFDRTRIDDTALDIQEHNTVHARLRSRGYAPGDSLKRALLRVHAPLAGIWGERDAVAWPEVRARLDVLRGIDPGLMEYVFPEAGHWVAYEAADQFNAALLEVLAARGG
ncbi:alpha/beta fold hydrolase [Sabulicella glaciei]|uniref:Alpha/beta fold hydrolase n=1 Tax=Sabulicella glaciei TaxID=2984948 RepID=A0ABT3NWH2_9PROT|nr:alpha/beta fold hydrolase [Roseococcus sp. MDT2-1-1]MCW8086476.1 alpha/beta fold hydrolase [Roseococcus sp. MDT2-1-1]